MNRYNEDKLLQSGHMKECIGYLLIIDMNPYEMDKTLSDYIGEVYILMSKETNQVPHFHIVGVESDFECSVRLDKPEYLNHVSKDKLSDEQKRILMATLCAIATPKRAKASNWNLIIDYWNSTNSDNEVSYTSKIPNYLELN